MGIDVEQDYVFALLTILSYFLPVVETHRIIQHLSRPPYEPVPVTRSHRRHATVKDQTRTRDVIQLIADVDKCPFSHRKLTNRVIGADQV